MQCGSILQRLPMQMDDPGRARPFMEIITILSDNRNIKILFKPRNHPVGIIRLPAENQPPYRIEKIQPSINSYNLYSISLILTQ